MRSTSAIAVLAVLPGALAHMSIWSKSMYGVGEYFAYKWGDPVAPLGPNWANRDDWWFRGKGARVLPPQDGAVSELKAGGTFTIEIACHIAFTSLGWQTVPEGSPLDACPGNPGAYHSGSPSAPTIDTSMLSGCALAIADVDDIEKVTMENLAIFTVQQKCVQNRYTDFEIPARMPPCTGKKCICGWFWLANNGTGNFYMTAFDCKVTGSPADATAIAPPVDPTWCDPTDKSCKTQTGSKRPLYAYNSPTNVKWKGNYDRPGYHDNWSFKQGAQNDIFLPAGTKAKASAAPSSAAPVASATGGIASTVGKVFNGLTGVIAAAPEDDDDGDDGDDAASSAAAAPAATTAAASTTRGRRVRPTATKAAKARRSKIRHPRQFANEPAKIPGGGFRMENGELVHEKRGSMNGRDLTAEHMFDREL